MSVSYWIARKFGVLLLLFYVAVMASLVITHYRTGVAERDRLAQYYPPGRYESSDKYQKVREIYGFTPEWEERLAATGNIDILSYAEDGVVVQRTGKNPQTVTADEALQYLANRNSAEVEAYISPLYGPLSELMDLHLAVLRRIERAVGGEESGWRTLIIPKVIISGIYLGLVWVAWFIFRRADRASKKYQGGFALMYGAFVMWPIAMIIVSFAGTSVVDVMRHLPDSAYFLRGHVLWAWAAMFAWPAILIVLCLFDILHAALRVDLNRTLAHCAVLVLGVLSIPVVTVGILFALLSITLYIAYRAAKKVILPSSAATRAKARR